MLPWELIDEEELPDSSGLMQLFRRGDEFVIRVDRKDLMSSRVFGSEQELARLACADRDTGGQRVLVGGLGMGFTLAATLAEVASDTEVVVAELVPAVVAWNEGVLGELAGNPLADSRVEVFDGDVCDLIRDTTAAFDVIMLDVDNGPDGLTQDSNTWLYEKAGLAATLNALTPNGVLAVWAAFDDPRFTKRLRSAGFSVEVVKVRARGKKGARHTIWVASAT